MLYRNRFFGNEKNEQAPLSFIKEYLKKKKPKSAKSHNP
jgi:hypothetical protein